MTTTELIHQAFQNRVQEILTPEQHAAYYAHVNKRQAAADAGQPEPRPSPEALRAARIVTVDPLAAHLWEALRLSQ
jgi:hypothetical protein